MPKKPPLYPHVPKTANPFPDLTPQTYSEVWGIVDREKLRQYCEKVWGVPVDSEAAGYMARLMARQIEGFKSYLPVKPGRTVTLRDMWDAAGRYF